VIEEGDGRFIGSPWVLVFAGVTPLGRRRAQRIVAAQVRLGRNVVIFDGHVPPIDMPDFSELLPPRRILIRQFGADERRRLASRLVRREPSTLLTSGALWRHVGRRLGTLLRPSAVWATVRSRVHELQAAPGPVEIFCCDEPSITSAWRASRIWRGVPVRAGETHE
jgi:hypothetical protein